MQPLTPRQLRIMQQAMRAAVRATMGLRREELREAIRPIWAQAVTDLYHAEEECFCHHGGQCLTQVTAQEQDTMLPAEHSLSLETFLQLHEEAHRRAVG